MSRRLPWIGFLAVALVCALGCSLCGRKKAPVAVSPKDTVVAPVYPPIAYDTVPRTSYSLGPHENLFVVVKPGVIKDSADMARLVDQITRKRGSKFTTLLVFDDRKVARMDEDFMLKKEQISRRIAEDVKAGKITKEQGQKRFNKEAAVLTETHLRPLAEHTVGYYLMGTYQMHPGWKLYYETKADPNH